MTAPSALRARCDLDELEKAAMNATAGPWKMSFSAHGIESEDPDVPVVVLNPGVATQSAQEHWEANAAHITAANPAVVLELVRRLREAEAIVTAIAAEPPGEDGSGHCHFCCGGGDQPGETVNEYWHGSDCLWLRARNATRREEG